MHNYTCFITARCSENSQGKWAVLTCPHHARWTVTLAGKAHCQDTTKLYLLGVLAALDDLTTRCGVILTVDDAAILEPLEAIGEGLSPQIGNLSIVNALRKQFDRHQIMLARVPHFADKRWKIALQGLRD